MNRSLMGCPQGGARSRSGHGAWHGGQPGSCSRRLPHFVHAEVGLIRRPIGKRLVRPAPVVEPEVALQRRVRFWRTLVGMQVDLLVLHASPQPLDEHIVDPSALAVHADADALGLKHFAERGSGKLRAMVGVEDLRAPEPIERLLERLDTEVRGERIGQPPGEHLATGEVQDRRQVEKAPGHRQIGDVGRPHLVWPLDGNAREQVRVERVPWVRQTRSPLAVDRLQPHAAQQRSHVPATHGQALALEHRSELARPQERMREGQLIEAAHERQIRRAHWPGLVWAREMKSDHRSTLAVSSNLEEHETTRACQEPLGREHSAYLYLAAFAWATFVHIYYYARLLSLFQPIIIGFVKKLVGLN